jgi:hypothetical protein
VIRHNEAAVPSSFADYGADLKLNLTQGQNKGQSKLEIIGDNADAVLPSSFASLPGSISCDDAKLKVNRGQNKRSGNLRQLERIADDNAMVVPPIVASRTDIEVNGTMSKTKSHEELKNNKSKIETISPDRYSEPIPMSFYSSSATHPYRRMQHPFTSTKDGDNPRNRTSESQCRESMHVNRRTIASTTDHCEPVDLENGLAHTPFELNLTNNPELEQEKCSLNESSSTSSSENDQGFPSNYNPNSASALPVASPVDAWIVDSEDKTVYEATEFEATTPFYKTRRGIACTCALTVLLSIIFVVVAISTPQIISSAPIGEAYVKTCTSGILERDFIQEWALKRNATFCDMSICDPRMQALEWIMFNDDRKLNDTGSNLIQRYTLALLAFQLDFEAWGDSNWLNKTDVCEWYGVTCLDGTVTEISLGEFYLHFSCSLLSLHAVNLTIQRYSAQKIKATLSAKSLLR